MLVASLHMSTTCLVVAIERTRFVCWLACLLCSICYGILPCLGRASSLQNGGQGHSIVCRCSDEIYANSIFKPDSQFTSLAVLASNPKEHGLGTEDVQSYVHVMFGLSKDWCASGLRVGCLWTLNAPVQNAMQNLSYFCAVSGVAQHMLVDMLDDTAFVHRYLKENLRRLGAAYDTLAGLHLLLPLVMVARSTSCFSCLKCSQH